jgi:hypothetical protein
MGDCAGMGGEGIPGGSSALDGEGVSVGGACGGDGTSGEGSGEVIDGEFAIGVSGGVCGGGDGDASGAVKSGKGPV